MKNSKYTKEFRDSTVQLVMNSEEYFNKTNRVSLAIFLGVIPSSALVLLLHWILPFDLLYRESYIHGSFFTFWTLCLYVAMESKSIITTIKTHLYSSASLILFALVFHGVVTKHHIFNALNNSLFTIFYFELFLIALIFILIIFAIKIEKISFFKRFITTIDVQTIYSKKEENLAMQLSTIFTIFFLLSSFWCRGK